MKIIMSITGGDHIFRIDQIYETSFNKGKQEYKEVFQVTHFNKKHQLISKNIVKNWSIIQPWIRNMTNAGYKVHRL